MDRWEEEQEDEGVKGSSEAKALPQLLLLKCVWEKEGMGGKCG